MIHSLYDEWFTPNDPLTRFRKARELIVGRVRRAEFSYAQGTQYSEEYLVVRERGPISTEKPPVREPGTDWNHPPVFQAHNDGSSANSQ